MTIGWERSQDNDFSKYELYSGLNTTNFELLTTIDDQDITAYFVSEFDPRVNNYFRVTVYDTLGLKSTGSYLSNTLRLAPNSVAVTTVSYTLSEMTITWETYRANLGRMQSMLAKHGQSPSLLNGTDFISYELLYSETEVGDKTTLATITAIDSTTYTLTEFDPNHENWFWVKVTDYWELTSSGAGKSNTINNAPMASFTVLPTRGTAATTFTFDASGCTDTEEPTSQLRVRWDWENNGVWDTEYDTTKTASHHFIAVGNYTTILEVQDSWGLADTTQEIIIAAELITDIDGNVYKVVTIGDQVWMAENLKVTHYRDGTAITNVTDDDAWVALATEAYCIYDNNAANEVDTYGALYNWYAVTDAHNIALVGWHVPSDAEWQTLVDYLGGSSVAGGKLKETGAAHWNSPNTGATNESGFTALPGGFRNYVHGRYDQMGAYSFFWSATENVSNDAWYRRLYSIHSEVYRGNGIKRLGFSVRLVKD